MKFIKIAKKMRNKILQVFYCKKKIKGKNNVIHCNSDVWMKYCSFIINGDNNKVEIGKKCCFTGLRILIEGNGCSIIFGDNVIVNASKIQPTVINAINDNITIGKSCLFSNNIEIHTSDYHGIYDKNGDRINNEKRITIGNHCWIGLGSKILKGTAIPSNSIVGAGSLLTKSFEEENTIIAGVPAKIVKRAVFWDHGRKAHIDIDYSEEL